MTVIINEFEVIAEPPTPPPTSNAPTESSATHGLTPEDVEQIMKYFYERQERVHAD